MYIWVDTPFSGVLWWKGQLDMVSWTKITDLRCRLVITCIIFDCDMCVHEHIGLEINNTVSTACIGNLLPSWESSRIREEHYTITTPITILVLWPGFCLLSVVTQSLEVAVRGMWTVHRKASVTWSLNNYLLYLSYIPDVTETKQRHHGGAHTTQITMIRVSHTPHHTHYFTYGVN